MLRRPTPRLASRRHFWPAFPLLCLGFLCAALSTAYAQPPGPVAAPGTVVDLPANNDVNDGTDNTDVGLLQVEVGGVFTRSDATAHGEGTPLTFRYGAFEWLELSAGTDGYLWQRASDTGPAAGVGRRQQPDGAEICPRAPPSP